MKQINLDDLLYLNDPVKLASVSYFLDPDFIDEKFDKLSPALNGREYALNVISVPELKRLIQIYNPNFNESDKNIKNKFKKLEKMGLIKSHKGKELYSKTSPLNRKAIYFSFDNSPSVQNLLRYALNTSVELGIDYFSSLNSNAVTTEKKKINGRRWGIIAALVDKNKSINEICGSSQINCDTFYDNARPLAKGGLIKAPFLSREDRRLEYVKTYRFNDYHKNKELCDEYKGLMKVIEKTYLNGEKITDERLHSLFSKKNPKTINSFRLRMEKMGYFSRVNNPSARFELTQLGHRLYNRIIKVFNHFFSGDRTFDYQPPNDNYLKTILNL